MLGSFISGPSGAYCYASIITHCCVMHADAVKAESGNFYLFKAVMIHTTLRLLLRCIITLLFLNC